MNNAAYWIVACWGVAVLVSWAGWGSLVAQWAGLQRRVRIDWGLRAAWGMGVTLAIGGVLLWLHLATETALEVLVLLGVVLAGADSYRHFRTPPHREQLIRGVKRRGPWLAVLWGLGGIAFLGSVVTPQVNWWDDLPAYLPFMEKMLSTGSIIEPFSWRRLATYGGQILLQGETCAIGGDTNAYFMDKGLSVVVMLGLIAGMFRGKGIFQKAALVGVALVAVTVDVPHVNTQSQLSGVVLFLALIRTLQLYRAGERRRIHVTWLVALLGAGLAAFRMNFIPGVVLAIVLGFVGSAWRDAHRKVPAPWRRSAGHAMLALLMIGVILLPWGLALNESSGSLMYPLMHGNQRPEFNGITRANFTPWELMKFVAGFLMYWKLPLLIVPAVVAFTRRGLGSVVPIYVAGMIGAVLSAVGFSMAMYSSLYRYSFAMLFAGGIAALAVALGGGRVGWRATAAGVAGALLLAVYAMPGLRNQEAAIADARAAMMGEVKFSYPTDPTAYREAQEHIPKGQTVLAMVSTPSLLDFQRNNVLIIDYPGAASPDATIPFSEGPDAVAKYLLAHGIHYLMASNFDTTGGIYSRSYCLMQRDHPEKFEDYDRPDAILAPVNLAAQAAVDGLAARGKTFSTADLRVIKID